MATRRSGGVLDLSKVEPAPTKVKLPDGNLYDMANPDALGALPIQRLSSRYRRAQELMSKSDATEPDVEEMIDLLLDVCEVVIPKASREILGELPLPKQQTLIEAFFNASPVASAAARRAEAKTSGS